MFPGDNLGPSSLKKTKTCVDLRENFCPETNAYGLNQPVKVGSLMFINSCRQRRLRT